ncbi:hypothetical protein [Demequina zhanjiangensis]|uniref:Transcriptional regulator, TetR family n=1 Tax=Demequina zhanjiangensis TaxID=3051659 RepID=A0ABT8G1B0_9MICO|nr:hypothetical protein [Demequina sp. SYSU T00b26]MDN4472907.1 hypothetical protein [Demequina sp. SYSU T00b26]
MAETSRTREDARTPGQDGASRAELVEHLARTFAATGGYGDTLEAIERDAHVDLALLVRHFGDRATLLVALLEWHDMRGVPEGYEDLPPKISMFEDMPVEDLVTEFVETARRNTELPGYVHLISILTAESCAPRHPARDMLKQRHELLRGILAHAIAAQRERVGRADDPLTPEQRAAAAIATWEGLQAYQALNPDHFEVPQVLELTLRSALELPVAEGPHTARPAVHSDSP